MTPPASITICEAPHDSPLYHAAVALRSRVLREPLGLHFTPEQLAAEAGESHWVAMENATVLGSVSLTADRPPRLRQMAVEATHQRRGIGSALLRAAADHARASGATCIELHARVSALPFYLHHGGQIVSEPYREVGLPHRTVRLAL